jgi:two-component system chemotaxis response regulator CheB
MEHYPLPVIIVSSVTQTGSRSSIEALAAGAIEVIAKPGGPHSVGQVGERLKRTIRGIRRVRCSAAPPCRRASPRQPARRRWDERAG